MLRKIMQRLESIERRLSRLEQSYPHKEYDPVWTELEDHTRSQDWRMRS